MRALFRAFLVIASCSALPQAQAQQLASTADDAQNGHSLSLLICSSCHVVGPDQLIDPILEPPAPSFEAISRRSSPEAIRTFLTTTHRNISNPAGMPNPELFDFQIRQVQAYISSLRMSSATSANRKQAAAQSGSCEAEINHVESLLNEARANGTPVGSKPESSAARLHHQPTLQSIEQATREAEKNIETALKLARRLHAEGLEAECLAMLTNVNLNLGRQ
ncbi:MAG TPA: hypothetical protein VHB49_23160 [Bradyrhizobium sp.]|nr:hypothetical protein [Bradyrhizobium sp.]